MSEQGLTPDDLVQLSQDQTAYCIYAAALALVVYDALLSFTQEIRCIWKRKLSVVTVLYLFIRYGTVLDMFLQLLDRDYVPQTIPE
ncbi:hypothetical protein QCA50_012343 [Cerrena zonata]|uniref:DUF6533 domain-containing protein n=1 Tax=Cerrena zonata TaxID=2478898 RepID=A0AAW0FUB0_9APHY